MRSNKLTDTYHTHTHFQIRLCGCNQLVIDTVYSCCWYVCTLSCVHYPSPSTLISRLGVCSGTISTWIFRLSVRSHMLLKLRTSYQIWAAFSATHSGFSSMHSLCMHMHASCHNTEYIDTDPPHHQSLKVFMIILYYQSECCTLM